MRSHEHSKRREEGNRVESLAESPLTFAGGPVTIPAAPPPPPPDPTPPVAEAVTWTLKSGKILIMVLAGSESHPATDYDPQSGALFATSPFLSNSTN
ncbi:hypothetical protein ATANTOWER_001468, partial [Ataeniobius toweri]|nr:hypothetical protein [Ataeniobius toweri]